MPAQPDPTTPEFLESEQRYRSLFQHHPDAIFVLSRVPRLLSSNPAAERISGYSSDELARLSIANFVVPEYLPKVLDLFNQALSGTAGAADVRVRHKDGTIIDLSLTLVPMYLNDTIDGVYGIAQDITERVLVEQERAALLDRAVAAEQRAALLAEASAALSESLDYEQTLGTLAQTAVPAFADWCAVDVVQPDGSVRRIVGALRADLQDRVSSALQVGDTRPQMDERQREFLQSGQPIYLPRITEELIDTISQSYGPLRQMRGLELSGFIRVPMLARGNLIGSLSFGRTKDAPRFRRSDLALATDIARRAAMAIDNARLYREAQDALQTRDQFLASASHDLRTPVTTIKAMSQVLQRRVPPDDPAAQQLQDGLRTIDETAGRITALINELLDLSRLQSGRPLELERRPSDLVELTRHAVQANEQISDGREIRIEAEVASLLGFWDPLRLERVLNNLLSNALKYSPDGGAVTLRLSRERGAGGPDSDIAMLTVTDQGIGIPESDLPRIFERFYRARNATGRPGTGIGLAGARDIVLQHGGSIHVESHEGDGTTFIVRLPLSAPEE